MPEQLGKIPQAKISSLDINSFSAGLDQRGASSIAPNAFSASRNAMVTQKGKITHRLALKRWLPDTIGPVFEIAPAIYNGILYYFTADSGKIRYCTGSMAAWQDCGGTNVVTTDPTRPTTFLRVLDKMLILNGTDNLGYVDLTNLQVVHFNLVADPTLAPTGAPIGLTGSTYKVYYAIWYSSVAGKTKSSPILTQTVSKIREQWAKDGSQGVTITDPNTRPAGATAWNVGLATAPAGGTIQLSDILPLAIGLDLGTTTFVDNGSITQLTNAGLAPTVNSTQGPKARYGVEISGRPFLFGITDDPYKVAIGGDGKYALDFTETNGGYSLILNNGTDFYPSTIVGFRNGQGIPSITVLYSSVSGLSKASIIEQNTVSLGTFSMSVWGSTDQNYGSSGVSSPYAVTNYRGTLIFPSTDGITSIDTSKLRFNVLTAERISDPVVDEVSGIRTELLPQIVGTAWSNRVMLAIPARGFTDNNEILVYDVTNKGAESWYTFDIAANWIGTVSPPGSPGFVYITQGNHTFRLEESYVAQDETADGTIKPFPVQMTSGIIGSNTAHNGFFAVVQAVFYLTDFIGSADIIVYWRDYQSGNIKSKLKRITNGTSTPSTTGNWSSPGYLYAQKFTTPVITWSGSDTIVGGSSGQKISKPYRIQLNNVITNELQAGFSINSDNSAGQLRSVSFEGQPLGISPDVR